MSNYILLWPVDSNCPVWTECQFNPPPMTSGCSDIDSLKTGIIKSTAYYTKHHDLMNNLIYKWTSNNGTRARHKWTPMLSMSTKYTFYIISTSSRNVKNKIIQKWKLKLDEINWILRRFAMVNGLWSRISSSNHLT